MNEFIDTLRNHYADYHGRASRRTYWMFVLFYVLAVIVTTIIDGILGSTFIAAGSPNGILTLILSLALAVPTWCLAIRRLHDLGQSGWFSLLSLVPFVNIGLLIYFAFQGQTGPNQYGPDPKETYR